MEVPSPAGPHQSGHPHLARCWDTDGAGLPTASASSGDGVLAVDQYLEQLHAGGVGEHAEHLDDQPRVIVGESPIHLTICVHMQIIAHPVGPGPPGSALPRGAEEFRHVESD